MHGSMNIQFINAKQAIEIHAYKNTKRKLTKLTQLSGLTNNGRTPHMYINLEAANTV
jgi:hypothetical protein